MKIGRFGEKAYSFVRSLPQDDPRITILEGAVRSGKTWALHIKTLALCKYLPDTLGVFTGVSKDTIYDNVLRDLFDLIGRRNYNYNRMTGTSLSLIRPGR